VVVSNRPRILVLQTPGEESGRVLEACRSQFDLIEIDGVREALALIRAEHFDGMLAFPTDFSNRQGANNLLQAERILQLLAEGVAVLDLDLKILWCNPAFSAWAGANPVGQSINEALGDPKVTGPEPEPFKVALAGKTIVTRFSFRSNQFLEVQIRPVLGPESKVLQLLVLARDITAETLKQQKLDALHKAGRELAALSADQLNDMSIEERVEMLKLNIRRFTHELLHYDVVEIRLLDHQTGKLEPLLQEGMTPEAAQRVLYAKETGNGVTGLVAATGKSYFCPDANCDPHYLLGAAGAHSSMTVPLIFQEGVIGTFNVESPLTNAFGLEDLQFAEIFSRELAASLHTLELLSAEKRSSTTQSIDAINREVALPVDDILGNATAVLDRYIGHDPEMAAKLRQIIAGARAIKLSIQKVGEDLAPATGPCSPVETSHPRLKGIRVLVADNDERVRRTAHGILGRWGCIVETARDGQEALTMAKLSNYDAILVDIRLPDFSGYDVYKTLRDAQPKARVILMTTYGYDPSHSIVKARQEGLRFVLYKPFRIDQLLETLECQDPPAGGNSPPPTSAPQHVLRV
jgi:CheY-like chemotaxis protein/PAS domain-containing protein